MTKIETLTVWANQRLRAKGQTDTQTDITTTRLNRSQGRCSENCIKKNHVGGHYLCLAEGRQNDTYTQANIPNYGLKRFKRVNKKICQNIHFTPPPLLSTLAK